MAIKLIIFLFPVILLLPLNVGFAEDADEIDHSTFTQFSSVYVKAGIRYSLTIDESGPLGGGRILSAAIRTPKPEEPLNTGSFIDAIESSLNSVVGIVDAEIPTVVHIISRSLVFNPTLEISLADFAYSGPAGLLLKELTDSFPEDSSKSAFTAIGTNDRLPMELPYPVSITRGEWNPRRTMTTAALQFSKDACLWTASFNNRSHNSPALKFGNAQVIDGPTAEEVLDPGQNTNK